MIFIRGMDELLTGVRFLLLQIFSWSCYFESVGNLYDSCVHFVVDNFNVHILRFHENSCFHLPFFFNIFAHNEIIHRVHQLFIHACMHC